MHRIGVVRPTGARRLAVTLLSLALTSGGLVATTVAAGAGESGGLGPKDPATGPDVTIGMITEGGSEAIGTQSAQAAEGARIAVKYANQYRNGVGGSKIELFVCGNEATPAGATDCANQMVERGVAAVVLPFTGQGAAQVPIITGAGIPYITTSGASQAELTTEGAFAVTGGYPVTLAVQAADAADKGYEKFVEVVIDVPAATQGAEAIGGIVYEAAGVDFEVVTAPPGSPDLTPQLQSAVDGGADAIGVTGDITFCTSFLQAYETLALDVPKYVIATCIAPEVIDSLGDVLKGSRMTASFTPDKNDPDRQTYAAAVKKFGERKINPDPSISTGVASGFVAVMNFVNGMEGFTGDVTAAAVLNQFNTATDVPSFLTGGLTFTCNGQAVPLLQSICSAQLGMGTLNAKGKVRGVEDFDVTDLFAT